MIESKMNINKPLILGILGGGQLAKMISLEAYKLGLNVAIIENGFDSPAGAMTKFDFGKGWNDREELDKFINSVDVITLENEFIDINIMKYIASKKTLYPSPSTMELVQDKFVQKSTFRSHSLSVPNFEEITSIESLNQYGDKFGFPFVLKTRTLGYDGYGNFTIKSKQDIEIAWNKFNSAGSRPLMAEEFITFDKELAVTVARNLKGEVEVYPCVETIQENHICKKVIAPAEIVENTRIQAQSIALKCIEAINGIGVFSVEMFYKSDGKIYVNEIAPRPHNSAHYTIEGCYTSQFENCIRAVLNLPLGSSELIEGGAVMINLLGERDGSPNPTNIAQTLSTKQVTLHLYGKQTSRKGRKMGHLTAIAKTNKEAESIADKAFNGLVW